MLVLNGILWYSMVFYGIVWRHWQNGACIRAQSPDATLAGLGDGHRACSTACGLEEGAGLGPGHPGSAGVCPPPSSGPFPSFPVQMPAASLLKLIPSPAPPFPAPPRHATRLR